MPRGRLEQVLVNLTRNAFRAVAEEGSAVVLFARAEDEWALVGVEDDGPGMPPTSSRASSSASTAAAPRAIGSAAAGSG